MKKCSRSFATSNVVRPFTAIWWYRRRAFVWAVSRQAHLADLVENTMPGGTHVAVLSTGQKLPVSRLQSRVLRERFLKL